MVKVKVWPIDDTGCGNYRLRFPAQALKAQGADVEVDQAGPLVLWNRAWRGDHPPLDARVVGLAAEPDADVVVFQRPTWRPRLDTIIALKQHGVKIVVDVDDLLDGVSRQHVAYQGFRQDWSHHRYLDEACKLADLVTVSTPALLARYGHGHGVVLPNMVPAGYLNVFGLKRPDTVGWSGIVGTHPGDLQATGGAVAAALPAGWGFHVIGPPDGVRAALGLREEPSVSSWVEFRDYPAHLAELEVGIVPLADTPFNRCKSGLKASEMAAVGVPVVMSPTPDNLRVHRLGVGLVAESRGQWRRHVARLTSDVAFRYDLAERGREAIASQTYEAHCGRWWEAWSSLATANIAA